MSRNIPVAGSIIYVVLIHMKTSKINMIAKYIFVLDTSVSKILGLLFCIPSSPLPLFLFFSILLANSRFVKKQKCYINRKNVKKSIFTFYFSNRMHFIVKVPLVPPV